MSGITAYEIDFLPVGNGDRSGDAIAVRWKEAGAQTHKVLVYDGGTKKSGEALVEHIRKYYGTSKVDYLVNSHPDADHASGLSVVLEQLEVGEVWMHRPWEHSSVIRDYFHDGRITDSSLEERLKSKMAAAYAVEKLALSKGIPIYEPFQGNQIGPFRVMSPDKDWYVHELIAAFAKSPEQKSEALTIEHFFDSLKEAVQATANWIAEHWSSESLRENVSSSAENLSSVVLFASLNERGVLLTGDAGVESLNRTADYAAAIGYDLASFLTFIQVPHHGSRNNVSSSVLDRILGPRKDTDDGTYTKTAFVSASPESKTHPRKMVVNAFMRRGAKVTATQGQAKRHSRNMDGREGWVSATSLQFSNEVEKWD